jgi:hypothetical protein
MKTLVSTSLLLFALFASGCKFSSTAGSGSPTSSDGSSVAAAATANPDPSAKPQAKVIATEMLGSYVGAFGDNKISLLVTTAADNAVAGRSIVGGNDRPFEGTYTLENGVYTVTAREPGDHKDDGVFKFTVAQANPAQLKGTWKPNDTKRPEKSYTLERRKFTYKPDVGIYPQASTRLLKAKDVENMMKEDLEFMRSEIFARHGYCFAKKHLRQQFELEDWYVPDTTDIKGRLTEIEKKNIALIKRYEKYADEYGDEYGR